MIEIFRIVENQANLSSYRATQDEEKAVQLELLIEFTKPKNIYSEWDALIANPFRYSSPYQARFRPIFAKRNVFYGSLNEETTFYEYAYHFMKQRTHLKEETATGQRTLFSVDANDEKAVQLINYPNYEKIIDKNEYSFSHAFIEENPEIDFILYPSSRDPKERNNSAILNIHYLSKTPNKESTIQYFYDYKKKLLTWIDHKLHVLWKDVS